MKLFKAFYIQPRFFYSGLAIVVLFAFSYFIPFLFGVAQILILIGLLLLLIDSLSIFSRKNGVEARRILPEKLSNGDSNQIVISIKNNYRFDIYIDIIDELPIQFQVRDFNLKAVLKPGESQQITYNLKPLERGLYAFGNLNIYACTKINFTSKRYQFDDKASVPTYPSFKQLRQFELLNINSNLQSFGLKKMRRIGHSMEFEQIKDYVLGDDLRTINWKATAKKNSLMVNQFQDEKSQPVYCVIDTGRVMRMPFEGLSLLDYAINAALVLSNVALKKHDKAGLFSFSKNVENMVAAQRRNSQMQLLMEALYNIKTDYYESDYSRLYANVKRHITQRSLMFLFSNFETLDSLHRQLPYLKAMAKNHLVVVIFFQNTELEDMVDDKANTLQQIYDKVIAEKFAYEKKLIVQELKKYGITSILTKPQQLTVDTINKYLEIKSRGLL